MSALASGGPVIALAVFSYVRLQLVGVQTSAGVQR
jgi:hypothetical protein